MESSLRRLVLTSGLAVAKHGRFHIRYSSAVGGDAATAIASDVSGDETSKTHRSLSKKRAMPIADDKLDRQSLLVNLCSHRGFVYPSSDIYGGLKNAFDYGPLGTQMKRNLMNLWWKEFVESRFDVVGLDSSIILNPNVWKASGHVDKFTDPMSVCSGCNARVRADKLVESSSKSDINEAGSLSAEQLGRIIKDCSIECPTCGENKLGEPRLFNLLFCTSIGTTSETSDTVYLRPETAQGAYINFANVANTTRKQLPFGIAQMGKSFRNEVSPGNFLFRTREFEQMELQYFCKAEEAQQWYDFWVNECYSWLVSLGLREENLRKRVHENEELAHYALATTDIEYYYPFGWSELWGVANRGTYDLECHSKASNRALAIKDNQTGKSCIPYSIEPAVGANRLLMALLCDAYHVEEVEGRERVVLRLDERIAPYQLAVLPLQKKPELLEIAQTVHKQLSKSYRVDFDVTQSIGKRYRRHDEIGTPLCATVDFETVNDQCVTVRARDSMKQIRLPIEQLVREGCDFRGLNDA